MKFLNNICTSMLINKEIQNVGKNRFILFLSFHALNSHFTLIMLNGGQRPQIGEGRTKYGERELKEFL